MSRTADILERQWLHLVLLAVLLAAAWLASRGAMTPGTAWGLSALTWFWLALGAAIGHQVFVLLCWRLELHASSLSRRFGAVGFRLYAAGFAAWSAARLVALIGLALADAGSLDVDWAVRVAVAAVLAAPAIYTMYSVARYFTFTRAVGADHFDPSYRTRPLERRGIFRFVRNGMYVFGFLLLWLPGVLAASRLALLAALFSHLYIWVHYLCTERPDMRRIYGGALER